ncbi:MAG: FAD-dependent oxidoreductase [Parasporobacterium sp.]|nr:FAD-dependent oxidoreductase [Parasporobacterium sp.]
MNTLYTDILIIGAGAAGMAAVLAAEKKGYQKILLAERKETPGGVLLQCTHRGFGLGYFREDLTGIEYADRFRRMLEKSCAKILNRTMVLQLYQDRTALLAGKDGLTRVCFEKCIMATGCRERTIQSLPVGGTRPSGIMTCGTAQKLMNIDKLEIGDEIVILGTGDVGQIVARDLIKKGRKVLAMIEQNDVPGGLKRNQEQCLKAFSIPVMLKTQITGICGSGRIEGVIVRHLDTEAEEFLPCRTLLTAIGMIPEREAAGKLLEGASLPDWFYLVGNCDYVHDIVDSVTADAFKLESVL